MKRRIVLSSSLLLVLFVAGSVWPQPVAAPIAGAGVRKTIKAGSADARLLDWAIKLRRDGKIESSLSNLQQLVEDYPEEYKVQYNLGLALAEANRLDEAEVAFQKAIVVKDKAEISDGSIYNTIGWLYYLKGEDAQARVWLEKALGSKETIKEETRLRALNNLGLVYLRQGDFEKAKISLGEAARLGSRRAEINLQLVSEVEEQASSKKNSP